MTKTGQGTQARLGAVSSLSCPVRPTTAGADASLASSCCRNRAPLTHPTTRGLASPAPGVTPSWRGGRGRGAGGGEGSRSASRSPGGGGEPVSRGGSRSGAVVEREGEGDGAQTANGGRRERAGRVAYATPRPRPAARGGGGGGGGRTPYRVARMKSPPVKARFRARCGSNGVSLKLPRRRRLCPLWYTALPCPAHAPCPPPAPR